MPARLGWEAVTARTVQMCLEAQMKQACGDLRYGCGGRHIQKTT